MDCIVSPFVAAFGNNCLPDKKRESESKSRNAHIASGQQIESIDPSAKSKEDYGIVHLDSAKTDTDNSSNSSKLSLKNSDENEKSRECAKKLDDVEIIKTIGTGRFGYTKIVYCKRTKRHLYMNLYLKSTLTETCQQHIPSREKEILLELSHPFIAIYMSAFQNDSCLFMLLQLPRGGDLSRLLISTSSSSSTCTRPLTERQKVFYAACVLSVFRYCHSKSIIYRGLHPDTILIDDDGYIKLIDWGFAKQVHDFTFTFCGHVEYLCPECIIYDTGYGRGADYWALGVLIYEMLAGRSAFVSTGTHNFSVNSSSSDSPSDPSNNSGATDIDDTNTVENIITAEIKFPSHFSPEACSLISGLCQKNPALRLGCVKNGRGVYDIMFHPWFRGIDWELLEKRAVVAPWVPQPQELHQLSLFTAEYSHHSSGSGEDAMGEVFEGYHHLEWNHFK